MARGRGVLLITGSGLQHIFEERAGESFIVRTRFGATEATRIGNGKHGIWNINRHGADHSVPAHLINHHANIAAADELGARYIISTSAVGAINPRLKVGSHMVVDQFIDMQKSRRYTIFDSPGSFKHTDMTNPYSDEIRKALISAIETDGIDNHMISGTYVCTDGPRYETPAEIKAYGIMGGDVVGMTSAPEAILANELEIPYATLAIVSNMAAGLQGAVGHDEVVANIRGASETTKAILDATIEILQRK